MILALLVIAALSIPAFGQQTVEEWLEEGNALSIQGNYTEAIMAFDKAIRLDPELTEARYNKGKVVEGLDWTSEANTA